MKTKNSLVNLIWRNFWILIASFVVSVTICSNHLVMVNWIFVFYGSSFWRPNSSSYFFVDVKKKEEISITSSYSIYLLKLHLHLIMCKQQDNYLNRWFEVSWKLKLQLSEKKKMLFRENSVWPAFLDCLTKILFKWLKTIRFWGFLVKVFKFIVHTQHPSRM